MTGGPARILVVPIGFVAALVVAVLVLINVGYERMSEAAGYGFGLDAWRLGWGVAGQLKSLVSWVAAVPALVVVLVGERARIQSVLYWLAGGALAAVTAPIVARLVQGGAIGLPPLPVMQVMATAGLAGGYVYWMIAGRAPSR